MARYSFLRKPWPWPLPALLAWGLCWGVFRGLLTITPLALALGLASATGVAMSLWGGTWWRRLLIGGGFPLSLALTQTSLGALGLVAWMWLIPLCLLLLVYPVNAWRDAPVFPTPPGALALLPSLAPLLADARILDAGCGAGQGLQALHQAYPLAQLDGLEWSWPLRLLSAIRCPWARVRRADIWLADWSEYDLVYLFQRPESMTRAVIKADALRDGAWLVSLAFEATHLRPTAQYRTPGGMTVWLYQAPLIPA